LSRRGDHLSKRLVAAITALTGDAIGTKGAGKVNLECGPAFTGNRSVLSIFGASILQQKISRFVHL
jgi:hypothetical protein